MSITTSSSCTAFDVAPLLSYLRALPGFQDLKTEFRPEATPGELEQWQDGNEPFVLPADLKGFLQITDGMSLRWKAESLQTEITVGAVDLNCLNRIERMEDVDSLLQRSAAHRGRRPGRTGRHCTRRTRPSARQRRRLHPRAAPGMSVINVHKDELLRDCDVPVAVTPLGGGKGTWATERRGSAVPSPWAVPPVDPPPGGHPYVIIFHGTGGRGSSFRLTASM